MTIFLLCLLICVICAGLYNTVMQGSPFIQLVFTLFFIIGLVALVALPAIRIGMGEKIARFESVKETIIFYRCEAVTLQVIEMNEWLASTKYYRNFWLTRDYLPAKIDTLDPIR